MAMATANRLPPALRDYQLACLRVVLERYHAGVRRQLIALPTGSGKTVIAAELPSHLGRPRTLFLVHREELLNQARQAFARAHPDLAIGVEHAHYRSDGEPVVIASVPSLAQLTRLRRFAPDTFGLIVVDECHHAVAPRTYLRILEHFGALQRTHHGLLLGITATPRRGDGVGLSSVFDEVTYTQSILDLIESHWLVPLRGWLIRSNVSLAGVRVRHGDFDERQLATAVDTDTRNQLVISAYHQLARGRRALVFAAGVVHAKHLAAAFAAGGVRAAAVWGTMDPDLRRQRIAQLRDGTLDVLTNAMLLTEGYDEPAVATVLMARPTCSGLLYQQMIGRGTRLAPGKTDCLVIDIVDNARKHARQLVTLPTLFGLPPGFDLKGKEAGAVLRRYTQAASQFADTGIPEDLAEQLLTPDDIGRLLEEVDLLRFAQVPPHIAEASPFTWQRMPDGRYLTQLDKDHAIQVSENVLGRFDVGVLTPEGPHKQAECISLPEGLRWASQLVFSQWPQAVPRLRRSAAWRGDPATARQLETLARLKVAPWQGITKGQASMLIERALLTRRYGGS